MIDEMKAKKDASDALPSVVRIPEATRERIARVGAAMSKRALTELPAAIVVEGNFSIGGSTR